MVFCRCPNCGRSFHISPAMDVLDWHEKFAPGLKAGEEPSFECFACWKPLAVGHIVRSLRENSVDDTPQEGVVIGADESSSGRFIVEWKNRQRELFKRTELHFCSEITDQMKDQYDLLCDATEDWYGIYEAKAILQDLTRARSAIEVLFTKNFISIWWYETWAGEQPPRELEGKDARVALKELWNLDKWWDAGEYMRSGYYAYSATEDGKNYFLSNPAVRFYMCNQWHQRAFSRGQIDEDLFRKIEERNNYFEESP